MEEPHLDKDRVRFTSGRGFLTLLSVLVVAVVAGTIAFSVVLMGIGTSKTALSVSHGSQAKALANACAEEALEQIRQSVPFAGSGGLSYNGGTCTYTVTNTGGSNRTVAASGTKGGVVRRVQVLVTQINPVINASWTEVAN